MPKSYEAERRAELEAYDRETLIALIVRLDDLTDRQDAEFAALVDEHVRNVRLVARQAKTIAELSADPGQLALHRTLAKGRA